MVINLVKKQEQQTPPHHIVSAVVALIAVVGLVVVFQSNGPTGNLVEMQRDLPSEVGGWKQTKNLVIPDFNEPRAHWDYCLHNPGSPNWRSCCRGGLNDKTCTDPCPTSKSSNPSDTEFTGNCCLQINRAPRCETWRDVKEASSRNTKECIVSGSDSSTLLC